MVEHRLIIQCDIPASARDRFYDWFRNQHLSDVRSINGVLEPQRFTLMEESPLHRLAFVVLYDLPDRLAESASESISGLWEQSEWSSMTLGPLEELPAGEENLEKWERRIAHEEAERTFTIPIDSSVQPPVEDRYEPPST